MTTTLERLSALLMKDFKLQPALLTSEATLESLGIDSLGTVELLWNIEDAFHIKLPAEPAPLSTLGDVARYVDELIASQAVAAAFEPHAMPLLHTP
jgi:acyl carrier protein